MPMIDVYAIEGTLKNPRALATDLAQRMMVVLQAPEIPLLRKNIAVFVHELPTGLLSNVDGESQYVRVTVLTSAGRLDRERQLALVQQFTDVVVAAMDDGADADHVWVQLTEAVDGGWGLSGHANTNAELADAAAAQMA
jgi:phenylpyruvate tautomerase PptA (4-oxalocrotonate tautomerase family)